MVAMSWITPISLLTNMTLTRMVSGRSVRTIRSTHHARIMLWNGRWMIQDLDSTNGTFLNGSRVTVPVPIPLGATVKVGATTFELRR